MMSSKRPAPKPPLPQEVETKKPFLDLVREHRKGLVAIGAVVALLVVGVILFFTFRNREKEKGWASVHAAIEVTAPENEYRDRIRLIQEIYPSERFTTQITDPLPGLEELRKSADADLMPHVLYQIANANADQGNWESALEALATLETEYQDHSINALPSLDTRYSLVGQLKQYCLKEKAWKDNHAEVPVEVDTTTTALFETNKGSFWVGFYPEHSPKHVEHFITRAKTGGYNGISVTSINRSYLRLGGEASKDEDPKNDEDEPKGLDPLPSEKGRYRVAQEQGALSSASIPGGESPTLLDIMLEDRPLEMDKRQTVFGRILTNTGPGMDTLFAIREAKTYGTSEDERYKDNPDYVDLRDHPVEMIRVLRVSIWKNGQIDEGHEWDTTAVVKPGTEPPPPPEVAPPAVEGEAEDTGEVKDPEDK